jgi:uncharacterized protein (TIGR02147 family)
MRTHVLETPQGIADARTFREFLQAELAKRCARNARYSLRAYANFLGVDHATLSQMLRGKRAISKVTVRRLGGRLGLSAAQIDNYATAQESASLNTGSERPIARLAQTALAILSQWYPAAILELMRLEDFRPDARWIARMLGITLQEVQLALHQLTSLGFLRMSGKDRWEDMSGGVTHGEEEFTLRAIERLAARSLQLQIDSARKDGVRPRFHGSSTLAVKEDRAAGLVAKASGLFSQFAQTPDDRSVDTLYRIEVHCFPLTPTENEE